MSMAWLISRSVSVMGLPRCEWVRWISFYGELTQVAGLSGQCGFLNERYGWLQQLTFIRFIADGLARTFAFAEVTRM